MFGKTIRIFKLSRAISLRWFEFLWSFLLSLVEIALESRGVWWTPARTRLQLPPLAFIQHRSKILVCWYLHLHPIFHCWTQFSNLPKKGPWIELHMLQLPTSYKNWIVEILKTNKHTNMKTIKRRIIESYSTPDVWYECQYQYGTSTFATSNLLCSLRLTLTCSIDLFEWRQNNNTNTEQYSTNPTKPNHTITKDTVSLRYHYQCLHCHTILRYRLHYDTLHWKSHSHSALYVKYSIYSFYVMCIFLKTLRIYTIFTLHTFMIQ